jgi:hypothetical protein
LRVPRPPFAHLVQLSDATGVFEHANGAVPRRDCGYCTDDVARALVVVLREPSPGLELSALEEVNLTFLLRAQLPDGRFHNRLSAEPASRWLDDVGSDDAIGRALWALGVTALRGRTARQRADALACFERGAGFDSRSPRANAAAILGAVEVLSHEPAHSLARALLERAAERLGNVATNAGWPWPEPRLAYENARLPEARLAAGVALRDPRLFAEGLQLLDWLVDVETRGEVFSFTGQHGWALGERRPAFDQQPVEAGAMADACARAFALTGGERWASGCVRAAEWFLGNNDVGVLLFDAETGGCADGLEPCGRNANQGAESTLAMISAFQHARVVQAAASAASSGAVSTSAAPT